MAASARQYREHVREPQIIGNSLDQFRLLKRAAGFQFRQQRSGQLVQLLRGIPVVVFELLLIFGDAPVLDGDGVVLLDDDALLQLRQRRLRPLPRLRRGWRPSRR